MGGTVVTEEAKDGRHERIPLPPLLALMLGAVVGVIHPGMLYFLFPTFTIPALLALVLQINPRTRSLAVGLGAASLGWLAYSVAHFVFVVIASP
jgi:hypothetical protein